MTEGVIYIKSRLVISKKGIAEYLRMFCYGLFTGSDFWMTDFTVKVHFLFFLSREKHSFNQAPGKKIKVELSYLHEIIYF